MDRKKVIVDVDPAIGIPFRDVDDALAILFLLASPNIDLEAITVNFGNAPAERGYEIAARVLEHAGAEVPLFKGARRAADLGVANPAVSAMIRLVDRNPGAISLVAVAPLTNVASAMLLDPGFAGKLGELIVMGGSFAFGPFARRGEFNLRSDPAAAEIVLSSPIRKTLISMDLCSHVVFGKREMALLKGKGGALQSWLADELKAWRLLNSILFRKGGFFPWDVVAAAQAIEPALFTPHPLLFATRTEGRFRGSIHTVSECHDFEPIQGRMPIDVPSFFDTNRFMEMFLAALLSY